jgi:SAM-dependent methyltransferase
MTILPAPTTVDQLMARYHAAKGSARLTRDQLEYLYWFFHPRFRFFKTVASNARLLDVGANQGGLCQWRDWNAPDRSDIIMYGVDLARGEFAGNYADWESGNLDDAMPLFPGVTFDAIFCSHLIEHIRRPPELLGWMSARLKPGGRLYLEWPNATTLVLPPRGQLEAAGWPVMISNFYDDNTHHWLPPVDEIARLVECVDFTIIERGVVDAGNLTDQLIDLGRELDDPTLTLRGFWSLTHWSTYLVAVKNAVSARP